MGVCVVQVAVEGIAVIGAVPSPAASVTAACAHEADVSVTVNVTARGAAPDVGTMVSEADAGPLVTTVVLPPPPGFKFILGGGVGEV